MRRRVRVNAASAPPLPLARFRGSTNREALSWMHERQQWWDATHDVELDGGWLPWLLDGWEQVGDLSWCGSIGDPCADHDCLCVVWPEYLSLVEDDPIQRSVGATGEARPTVLRRPHAHRSPRAGHAQDQSPQSGRSS